ncbi:MAG TPA: proton-conducting transporter membrane subunit, partial [Ilumatobacteraceae bacterium]|nr:proton-conducting transporter membrane subunit [Ilumatobacteraceae bacterium]
PLYIWLPDAMAGPTPVSALIHAATMVTSGVFLLTRLAPLLHYGEPWMMTVIAVVGLLTALFAATIAVAQNDIKKVLAYSTVSQIGFMVLAVGVGNYVGAIFHLMTH